MPIYPEFRDRVAVVTGASNGIGAVTARAFAEQKARVALVDIDDSGAAKIAGEITAAGGKALTVRTDVTDEQSVAAAIATIAATLGGIDILVNSAGGYGRLATVEDISLEEWDRTVALNLRSVFLVCRAAIPHLKQSKAGRIINVASISGRTISSTTSPAYSASKAGVIQFTRFLAFQLGQHNITSNAIAPITTLTARVAALRTEAEIERIAAQVPLKRLATPEDHAQAMLFLASDAAAYINGVALDVNGGRIMM
jgi:3-oxoacyl-[acyl-carrier protein] reductase